MLVAVTVAALLMAALLPVAGLLADRYGPKPVYQVGLILSGLAVFPAFALFTTGNIVVFTTAILVVFGVVYAVFYGVQGTLYASLYPARIRYTGLSTVYQLSGVYASGLTPLILTALMGAGGGSPWLGCAYLVAVTGVSVLATRRLRPLELGVG